jgi:hypothetical protein
MAEPNDKIGLAADLNRARARIARNMEALRHDLDVGTHFKESFRENKATYIGGAALAGLLLAKLPGRRKKTYTERKSKGSAQEAEKVGVGILLLEFLLKMIRPMLTSLVTKQVTQFVQSRGWGGEK